MELFEENKAINQRHLGSTAYRFIHTKQAAERRLFLPHYIMQGDSVVFIATGALSCAAGAAFFDNKLESHDAKTGRPGDKRINKHEAIPPRRPDARGIFSPSRCEEWWLMINYLFLALCSARSDQSCWSFLVWFAVSVFGQKESRGGLFSESLEKGEIEPLQEQFAGAINCLLFREIID